MTQRAPAKEFPADLEWVNATRAPQLGELRGRVILLWFWTYDCVNCWSVIPDLRFLEDKYHDGLTVVGVHSPKYPQQVPAEGVLRAVNRHRLRHAVANDPGFRLWQEYGVTAWPSVVLIDAEGRFAALFAGEGRRGEIDAMISRLLEEAALRDLRVYEPAPPALRPEPRLPLAFPGKLLADAKNLYVADSGHHRILECTHEGRVLRQFGSGNPGFSDGLQGEACFDDPQGLAHWRDTLLVADRGNHAVRRISLSNGSVDTLIGRGRPGRMRPHDVSAQDASLHSPSDLALLGDDLYVAVSGLHQIWRINLVTEQVSVLAGSGQLGLVDGIGGGASFAQPSALGVLGRHLAIADAAARRSAGCMSTRRASRPRSARPLRFRRQRRHARRGAPAESARYRSRSARHRVHRRQLQQRHQGAEPQGWRSALAAHQLPVSRAGRAFTLCRRAVGRQYESA